MTESFTLPNYRQARDAWAVLLKHGIGLQPSNPFLEAHKEALHALSDAIDQGQDWEVLNPNQDHQTQLELVNQRWRMDLAQKGLFTEEQIKEADAEAAEQCEAERRSRLQQLEDLLPDDDK